jgi:hypothetical protein
MKPIEFSTSFNGQVIRSPKGYWAFIPAPLPPQNNWSSGLVSIAGEAERKLSELAWIGRNFHEPHTMLQRNLLYTAIIRARKLCVLAGSPRAICMAMRNNKVAQRFTALE